MCDMKSSKGWTVIVLYGFNGWTQIVSPIYLYLGKLGQSGQLVNPTKRISENLK